MLAFATTADWIILGVLVLVLLMLISLRVSISSLDAKLGKLHKALNDRPVQPAGSESSQQQDSAFEQFLAEDPTRLSLSKTEQFAAYREWRKEKGMNWSG